MASLTVALTSLRSYHLLAWGSLLGTQLFQSFVNTKLCHLYLPLPQFMTLQKHIFPIYFGAATSLTGIIAVTYPAGSLVALSQEPLDAGLLLASLTSSALNCAVYGPRCIGTLTKRNHAETHDGLELGASGKLPGSELSPEMYQAKRSFSRNHAMTIHLNLIAIICTLIYGVSLSSRMSF